MSLLKWLSSFWNQLLKSLYVLIRICTAPSWEPLEDDENKESKEKLGVQLRRRMYGAKNCDLHDILREQSKISFPERQLKINETHRTLEITERFHKNLKKLDSTSNLAEYINIIDETFLQFMPNSNGWNRVRNKLKTASEENDPELVINAYSLEQDFTKCLNNHLAANSHHFLKLYCTIQNCPILNQTQEYTEAFSVILTHPNLERYVVRNVTLYRGAVFDDDKLINNYHVNDIILTTTLISTSPDPGVAAMYHSPDPNKKESVPVLWVYKLNDEDRRSALRIDTISQFGGESEILLLRYIPFKIISKERDADGLTIIHLDQCSEQVIESNQSTENNHTSFQLDEY